MEKKSSQFLILKSDPQNNSLKFDSENLIYTNLLSELEKWPDSTQVILIGEKDLWLNPASFLIRRINSSGEYLGFGLNPDQGPIYGLSGTHVKVSTLKKLTQPNELNQFSSLTGLLTSLSRTIASAESDEWYPPEVLIKNEIPLRTNRVDIYSSLPNEKIYQIKLVLIDYKWIQIHNLESIFNPILTMFNYILKLQSDKPELRLQQLTLFKEYDYTPDPRLYKERPVLLIDVITDRDGLQQPPAQLVKKLRGLGLLVKLRTAYIRLPEWNESAALQLAQGSGGDRFIVWNRNSQLNPAEVLSLE